ncbi:MAG: hypothetical protein SOR95_08275 [Sutterella sp.]|nr:hypothetical protein [Sutterella sp.]
MSKLQNQPLNPALLAVKKAGGAKELGESLHPKVSRQAVEAWVRRGHIPVKRIAEVARVTKIPTDLLIPDCPWDE